MPKKRRARGRFCAMADSRKIRIYEKEDFDGMRAAGRLSAEILDALTDLIKPGVTTQEIDDFCADRIKDARAVAACLGYKGYPKNVCVSPNHVICHGIPSVRKRLLEGDIVNVDVTVILDGWHGDSSRMYGVGAKISRKAQRVCEMALNCLNAGIEETRPNAHFGDIGAAIQNMAEAEGYGVVSDFCGHGVGRGFHEAPNVMHVGNRGEGQKMATGMFFTIEPMINIGASDGLLLPDGWTVVTRDRKLSAQYEHSVGVTENGAEIFTLSPRFGLRPPLIFS